MASEGARRCSTRSRTARFLLCTTAAVLGFSLLTVASLFAGSPSIRPTLLRLEASREQDQVFGVLEADVLYEWHRVHRFTVNSAALTILVPCKGAGSPQGEPAADTGYCPALAVELTDVEYPESARMIVKFALTEADPRRLREALVSGAGSSVISFDVEAGLDVFHTGIIFTGSTNLQADLWSGALLSDLSGSDATNTSLRLVRRGKVATPERLGMNVSSSANYTLEWTMREGHIPIFLRLTPVHVKVDAVVTEATTGSVWSALSTDSFVEVEKLPNGGLVARLPLHAAAHANLLAVRKVISTTPFGPFDTNSRLVSLPGGEGEFEDRLFSFTARPPIATSWRDIHQVSVRSARSVTRAGPGRRLGYAGGVVQTHELKLNDNELASLSVSVLDGTPLVAKLALSVQPSDFSTDFSLVTDERLTVLNVSGDIVEISASYLSEERLTAVSVSSDIVNISASYLSQEGGNDTLDVSVSTGGKDIRLRSSGSLSIEANRNSSVETIVELEDQLAAHLFFTRVVHGNVDNVTLVAALRENFTLSIWDDDAGKFSRYQADAQVDLEATVSLRTQEESTGSPRRSTTYLDPSLSLTSHCKPFGWSEAAADTNTTDNTPSTHAGWKAECRQQRMIPDPLGDDEFRKEVSFGDEPSFQVEEDAHSYKVSAEVEGSNYSFTITDDANSNRVIVTWPNARANLSLVRDDNSDRVTAAWPDGSAEFGYVRPDTIFGNTASRELVLVRPWSAAARFTHGGSTDLAMSWDVNKDLGYLNSTLSVLNGETEVIRWATSSKSKASPSGMAMDSSMTMGHGLPEAVVSLNGLMTKSSARGPNPRMAGDMTLSVNSDKFTSVFTDASAGFQPLVGPAGPDRFDVALGTVIDTMRVNLTFYVERGADLATQAMGYGATLYDGRDPMFKSNSRVEFSGTTTGVMPTGSAALFKLVGISAQATGREKFSGSVAAADDTKIVFVPYGADGVGVFDAMNNKFTLISIGKEFGLVGLFGKFYGAALAANGQILFAPFSAQCVGVFDPPTSLFQCVDLKAQVSGSRKFSGAVAAGKGTIVFVPYEADGVGVFDVTAQSFKLVDITVPVSSGGKFLGGAATASGKIVFAPFSADAVGVFDPADDSFVLIDISSAVSGNYKFSGAVAANDGKAVFAPYAADGVGVFDPDDNSFVLVGISAKVNPGIKFHGAAVAPDGKILFAPFFVHSVGIFDPADSSLELHDVSEHVDCDSMFAGAAVSGNFKVVMAPYTSDGVGVFDLNGIPVASMSMTVAGLDYDALTANPTMRDAVVDSIKTNVLKNMPGLSQDNVVVTLRAGSVIAEVLIVNTPSVRVDPASVTVVLSNPEAMSQMADALVADIQQIEGIDSVATGPITVVATVDKLPSPKEKSALAPSGCHRHRVAYWVLALVGCRMSGCM